MGCERRLEEIHMSNTYRAAIGAALAIGLIGSSALTLAGPAAAASSGQTCYFGECGDGIAPRTPVVAPAPESQDSQVEKISEHGSWKAFASGRMVMVVDEFEDGSKFAIVSSGRGKVTLVLSNPHWHLQKGSRTRMTITVDGQAYAATVTAINETMLTLDDVSKEFLQAFYHGDRAQIRVGDFRAEMQSLPDAQRVIDDAERTGLARSPHLYPRRQPSFGPILFPWPSR
jgi:hypothetical protein